MTEIEEKLTELAIARHQCEQLSQEAKALLEEFKSSEPYASKVEGAASAKRSSSNSKQMCAIGASASTSY